MWVCRYDVKYGSAGFLPYGYHAGCNFALGHFNDSTVREDPAASLYFCGPQDFYEGGIQEESDGTVDLNLSKAKLTCAFDHSAEALCCLLYTSPSPRD